MDYEGVAAIRWLRQAEPDAPQSPRVATGNHYHHENRNDYKCAHAAERQNSATPGQ